MAITTGTSVGATVGEGTVVASVDVTAVGAAVVGAAVVAGIAVAVADEPQARITANRNANGPRIIALGLFKK